MLIGTHRYICDIQVNVKVLYSSGKFSEAIVRLSPMKLFPNIFLVIRISPRMHGFYFTSIQIYKFWIDLLILGFQFI